MNFKENINRPIFYQISQLAYEMQVDAFVIGGFARDLVLKRNSKDIDIVIVDVNKLYSKVGVVFAERLAKKFGVNVTLFKKFGTAQLIQDGEELEFVGARRESYSRDSRKPIVEDGTMQDDLERRDLTINALAISLNKSSFGDLIDTFNGLEDIANQLIRTPVDPDVTFSDDPLRMMRAVRFYAQLGFNLHPDTFAAIKRNVDRLDIISKERIVDELHKIFQTNRTRETLELMDELGLLEKILPEVVNLKGFEFKNGQRYKDNFKHTMIVVENLDQLGSATIYDAVKFICENKGKEENTPFIFRLDKHSNVFKNSLIIAKDIFKHETLLTAQSVGYTIEDFIQDIAVEDYDVLGDGLTDPIIWMKWVALLHDIGKPACKRFHAERGWTFDGHQKVSVKLTGKIFRRLKMTLDKELKYVLKVINNHERFKLAVNAKDAAMRRLISITDGHLMDAVIFNIIDTSSKHTYRRRKWNSNAWRVYFECERVMNDDNMRNFRPPIDGDMIMKMYDLTPSREVGVIKTALTDAILDEHIENNFDAALTFVKQFVTDTFSNLKYND